ncbi:ferric reductase-like transmembrane domain-containing protein [Catenuloplanes indicus]|uniref:DMSO/TMAO reductase YedYZ heme-binding membrane subunit n=1 Tax=Catenuloplanes indicus TaxID=137267 RepID=A0AAE3W685_9ACTN|nr:ferric reductase-like transmembrane domain-containing protein [Catenuloplanes indicus]MDQ0370356.1 DMSO/TMAO reductase YedYZ heme-binding membrane subunit [Catenuloplanes indicus]
MAKRKQVQRSTRETGPAVAPADGEKKKGMSAGMSWLIVGLGVVASLWAIGALTNAGVVPAAYLFAYLDFYAGVVVLVSLSITVMVGLAATDRLILTPKHRVLVQGVHRTTGTIAVSFLLLHVMVKILEAHASVIDLVIPFLNPNTLYVGMGTIAAWCLVGTFWSGVARVKFAGKGKPWMWRAVHSVGYLAWPPALGHGLLAGRAAATWVIVSYILCVVGVVIAMLVRVIGVYNKRISQPKAVPSAAKAAGKAQAGPLEAANGARATSNRPVYRGAVRNQPSAEESLSAPRGAAWGGFSDEGAEQRRQRQTPLPANALEETQLMSKISRDVVEEAEELVQAAARRAPATATLDEDLIETRPARRAPAPREPEPVDDYEDEAPRRPARRPLVPELVEEETPAPRRPRREDDYEDAPPVRRAGRDPEPEFDDDYEDEVPAPRRTRRPAAEAPAKPAPRRSRRTEDEEEFGEAQISAAATPPRRTRRAVEEPEETAAPRRARRAAEEDDDAYVTGEYETVSRRSRRAAVDEEDEVAAATAPRRARRAVDEDEEDEVAIATRPRRARRAAEEDDEEEAARPRRSHRATEDAEPEVAEVAPPRRARRAAPAPAPEPEEEAAVDEYWRPPANPVSRYEEEQARPDFNGDDTPTLVDLTARRAARSARPAKEAKTRRPGRAAADEVSDDEFWARMRGEAK